jgi:hypothetical protein
MLLTEGEARSLWCPEVRLATYERDGESEANGINAWHNERIPAQAHCVGAHCMMWRWSTQSGRGYCGLAGVASAQP